MSETPVSGTEKQPLSIPSRIPYLDYGGQGKTIHFAHANGYNPGCYRQLASYLVADYHVLGMALRPLWPDSKPAGLQRWRDMVPDLFAFFEQHRLPRLIGAGHSLGSVLTLMAALAQPERFERLILIDPVVQSPSFLAEFWTADGQSTGADHPLAQIARRRRDHWPDRATAFAHLRPKPIFAGLSDEALADYLEMGLRPDGDEVTLAFSREWEAWIYQHDPHEIWSLLPQVQPPMLIIYAEHSGIITAETVARIRDLRPQTELIMLPNCGHLLPMEQPATVAELMLDWLKD
ncbi:MAG: alpha/beta hydrolase [Anaerolineales bacterium]|nr:alpha/beta hydrolase [Anaerolineales bacterium]